MTAVEPPSRRSGVPGTVTIHCGECNAAALVPEDATFFICRNCDAVNNIFKCSHCHNVSVAAVPGHAAVSAWRCHVCGQGTPLPRFGRMPSQTAAELIASEELRLSGVAPSPTPHMPLGPPGAAEAPLHPTPEPALRPPAGGPSLGGFTMLSSSRPALNVAPSCTVSVVDTGVEVSSLDGHHRLLFAFADLVTFEISGRSAPRRAREGSGRMHLRIASGEKAAATGETVLRLSTQLEKAVLRHPTFTRQELMAALGPTITAWRSGANIPEQPAQMSFDQAVAEFERIIVLHERGQLAETEFVVQRAAVLKRIMARGADRRSVPHSY